MNDQSSNSTSYFEKYRLRNTIKQAQEKLDKIEGVTKERKPISDSTKNIIASVIIVFGLIISTLIYAYSNRYEFHKPYRVDKWTGKATIINVQK